MPRVADRPPGTKPVQTLVWQKELRACPDRPRGRQRRQFDALLALSALLDWPTGMGFASEIQVARDADVGERTVRRAITWARRHGWLHQARRGHGHKADVGYAESTASKWVLLLPEQQANSAEQPANSSEQQANSAEQPAITTGRLSESTPSESTPPGAAVSEAAQVLLDRTDATPEEAEAIADAKQAEPGVVSAYAIFRSKSDGALKYLVRKHRTPVKAAPTARSVQDAINPKICGHGGVVGACPSCKRETKPSTKEETQ
jgi:hypothetical protein